MRLLLKRIVEAVDVQDVFFFSGLALVGYAFGLGVVGVCLLLASRPIMRWVK